MKNCKYPFLIANTEDSSKTGEHWWGIFEIKPKKNFSFGIEGLKTL